MFESLIVTLREGIEAALVVGILLIYLRQSNKQYLNKAVYLGVGIAVFASIIGAFIFHAVNPNEEIYEGTLFLVAAIFVGSMMFWMMRTSKTLKKEIQQKVESFTSSSDSHSTWSKAGWGILLFTFLMVFREGVETVLFLSAVSLTTEAMLSFLGGIIGLGLSIIFCVFFVKGTLKINLAKFFLITEIVLGIFVVQLILNGYHEFAEAGLLPANKQSMALIGPIMRHNVLFLLAILIIPFLFLVISGKKKMVESLPEQGPERRKILARQKSQKTWKYVTATLWLFIICAITTNYVQSSGSKELPPPTLVSAVNGDITIPVSDLEEGKLYHYGYILDNTTIRFLAMKQGEHVTTTLDACQICGDYGYIQEGKNLVCLNCTAEIYSPTLGESGGCNPVPLPSTTQNGNVIIHLTDLGKEKSRFSHSTETETLDPVCQMKLKVASDTPQIEYKGKLYYFCSMEQCRNSFKTNPEKYIK